MRGGGVLEIVEYLDWEASDRVVEKQLKALKFRRRHWKRRHVTERLANKKHCLRKKKKSKHPQQEAAVEEPHSFLTGQLPPPPLPPAPFMNERARALQLHSQCGVQPRGPGGAIRASKRVTCLGPGPALHYTIAGNDTRPSDPARPCKPNQAANNALIL